MHRRAAAQAALKGQGPGTGQGAANGDVASDLNLPPTEVSQRGAQNGANAANRPLTPAEAQIWKSSPWTRRPGTPPFRRAVLSSRSLPIQGHSSSLT